MHYGVLACPHCQRVQLVEMRHATVSCRSCRKKFEPRSRRLFYHGEDEFAAREALVKASAQLQGMGIEDYSKLLSAMESERKGTVEELLAELSRRDGFSEEEFEEAVRRLRVAGDPARLLERLREERRVFEPRPGRFRLV